MTKNTLTYKPQKTATLGLRLKPEVREALERQAIREGVSRSALAERYLEECLHAKKLTR